ncbi:putative sphingolipid C4-monooxygenase [Helianthus annuus]|uniref:Putative fatty acid hydroxylase n=1 Tax=Helianthus annuus TaxID=4232 RepID=A0A251T6W5_HELAN|nr:putative sphingolipid C4-monooxygenase [Helianthus annuus]KAJ0499873.1 putative sphingolipid C4-monooxygenase [Helianthus annuus]KAJ0507163.1 putative sphingolipid C4-monooxygenase [Helianthus annuus]KAJ0683726.1 putative sphingolipid C4-monooxygenase [Helianthus annuus]KAJ0687688.1 putative sphingolipid C4-monooxygenase [Helianthus annuus]
MRKEGDAKNIVPMSSAIKAVLVQQLVHATVSYLLFLVQSKTDLVGSHEIQPPFLVQIFQIIIAMFVMDIWKYFMHRYMHTNKFLYRHVHAQHHKLVAPYATTAFYNHPMEGVFDTIGGSIAFLVSGMTARTVIPFFCLTVVKTVDDHYGLWLPGNVFHMLFPNNTAFHDIHHQLHGSKTLFHNVFSQFGTSFLGPICHMILLNGLKEVSRQEYYPKSKSSSLCDQIKTLRGTMNHNQVDFLVMVLKLKLSIVFT